MSGNLNFRISSALKDILGRDLITDDFIAVFELVKNSFDAHARQVTIRFENIQAGNGKIIIKDDGKGMSYDDLINKWLFVAYSAKKEGTEDYDFDYRSNLNNRVFAGAKGIGRFSCDKLGKQLYLETTKNDIKSKTEVLLTNWEKFEGDLREEFVNIDVLHDTKNRSDFGLKHGTVLVIEELRSEWDRKKYLKLKDSLAKLINPNAGNAEEDFKIIIEVPEELEGDMSFSEGYQKVNGEVRNFIFETLGLKTTKISATISEDGNYLWTELTDGGTIIYKIKEKNSFPFLLNIEIKLYYLNLSAKQVFARRMGISSNHYGHVFLYKNGFRIYPYGEPGEDPLKIDYRKTQGFRRYLGTTDLMGQIEIFSNTEELKETSTRGDGLIKTPTYYQLVDFFWEILRRLEKYVVDVQQWGVSIEDGNSNDINGRVVDLLAKLTGKEDLIEFEIPSNFFELIEISQINSADAIIDKLNNLAAEKGDDRLIREVQNATVRVRDLKLAKEEAEKIAAIEYQKANEATAKLKEKISENLFLKSINTAEYEEVIALIHHIGIYAGTINNYLKGISLRIQNDIPLSKEDLNEIIKNISFETKKILNVAAFATKANFKLKTEDLEINLIDYIREYIQNIIPTVADNTLKISFEDYTSMPFIRVVKPIEINIVIDNIVNNAKKSRANNLKIELSESEKNTLLVKFIDNGNGIEENNLNKIFDLGFTTTDGSGIGLYHVKEILHAIKGKISVINNSQESGVTIIIELK
ncbi:hypothetical protein A3860_36465 [Niastella vici]|uniref:histidine kinase n=1 Tax=Niastella vici TaxID=1703345 RepID=A0A1V9FN38_9BACT|nr:sensor histidine kinase [Niastella vici]OQP59666.1 hypothetical protein A3860_36465 [Niastella vici]